MAGFSRPSHGPPEGGHYFREDDKKFRIEGVEVLQHMAKRCEICGKTPAVGRQVSHAHNVSARRFEPNLQRVRAMIGGGVQRIRVCTRCLRSNKVVKAA